MSETIIDRAMSTTKAVEAATNEAPCPERFSTPHEADPKASFDKKATNTADSVPATRPTQPAVAVIRFQNMPRMKVANRGALKNPNRVCR